MDFKGMTTQQAAVAIVVRYADCSPADCGKLTAAIIAGFEHFRAQPKPEPKTCLTCKHLEEPEASHHWHRCNFRLVMPSCITSWNAVPAVRYDRHRPAVNITDPYVNCPTWEARVKQEEVGK